MDGFLPASSVTRRLSDIYSPIFSPATFLSQCESLRGNEKTAFAISYYCLRNPHTRIKNIQMELY